MSVATTTSKIQYTLTTGAQALAVPFYFLDNSHIKAVTVATETVPSITLVLGTDYTLTGAGNPAGGTLTTIVTVGNGLTTGSKVVIKRNLPITQPTSYSPNDAFPAKVHEAALDRGIMLAQQIDEQADRALRFPEDESGTAVLPAASERANKAIGFDSTGVNVVMKTPISGDGILATGSVGHDAIDPLFRVRSLWIDVREYSAVADGSTDNTALIQAAINATPSGGVLVIPAGSSYYKVIDTITVSSTITIVVYGQLRSTDTTKVLFLVTSSNVTFDFRGGSLRGPGTFLQTSASGANYGSLIEFRGTDASTQIKNAKVINPWIIDPPHAGLYFRFVDGWEVVGGNSIGGPTSQTGTNHFVILALDSKNWKVDGFENRPDPVTNGAPVQVFCNSHSAFSSSPGVMNACRNLGSWDKLIYQYIDGAIVSGCYSLNLTTGSKQSIRVGGRARVSNNILQGGVSVCGAYGVDVSNNYIYDFDHVGISFAYVGAIGTADNRDSYCGENTIIAAPAGGGVTEIYEGIRIESTGGTVIKNFTLGPNTIIGADMCAASAGGASANLGAISLLSSGSFGGGINIGPQTLISCGLSGIVIYDGRDITITGGECRDCGTDSSSGVSYGVKLVTSANRVKVDGFKCHDTRGGSSRLSAVVLYSGAGNFDNNTVKNCKAIGVKSGQSGLNVGNPFGTPYLTEIGGNGVSSTPLIGQFTMPAATLLDVANDAIYSSGPGNYSMIKITPLNLAAQTLEHGVDHLWVSSITAKTGFRVQTYSGGAAAGTEVYQYEIIQ